MSEIKNVLTNAGAALIQQAMTSTDSIILVKGQFGDGELAPGDDPRELTSLKNALVDVPITGRRMTASGNMIVTLTYNNADQEDDMEVDEIGIFARLSSDSSLVLLSYLSFGGEPDVIRGVGEVATTRTYDIPFVFASAEDLSVTVDYGDGTTIVTFSHVFDPEGVHAAGETAANKIPVLNDDAAGEFDITGNAATATNAANDEDGDAIKASYGYRLSVDNAHRVSMLSKTGVILGSAADLSYASATASASGLMSATDKAKLDGMQAALGTASSPTFADVTATGTVTANNVNASAGVTAPVLNVSTKISLGNSAVIEGARFE